MTKGQQFVEAFRSQIEHWVKPEYWGDDPPFPWVARKYIGPDIYFEFKPMVPRLRQGLYSVFGVWKGLDKDTERGRELRDRLGLSPHCTKDNWHHSAKGADPRTQGFMAGAWVSRRAQQAKQLLEAHGETDHHD